MKWKWWVAWCRWRKVVQLCCGEQINPILGGQHIVKPFLNLSTIYPLIQPCELRPYETHLSEATVVYGIIKNLHLPPWSRPPSFLFRETGNLIEITNNEPREWRRTLKKFLFSSWLRSFRCVGGYHKIPWGANDSHSNPLLPIRLCVPQNTS